MNSAFNIELKNVEREGNELSIQVAAQMANLEKIGEKRIQTYPSCLDAWDYCFCIAIGYIALSITTDEQFAVYLEDIHKASSGIAGDYDNLQTLLGKLLYHKDDHIDIVEKNFKNRSGENAYGAFHRLLWGHDILSTSGDNPFVLMIKQKGLSGIVQAFQHLVADTTSKQGLPLPGSSYLDFEKENGAVSNYLIKIAEDLSKESVGNKRAAQSIYSHLFTIRAEDCAGNVTVESLSTGYFKMRGIENSVRRVQFKLIAYIIAFLGHSAIGTIRQDGVPYINIPEFKEIVHNLTKLYVESWKDTKELIGKSEEYIKKSDELIQEVAETTKNIVEHHSDEGYAQELRNGQVNVTRLIGRMGKGEELK